MAFQLIEGVWVLGADEGGGGSSVVDLEMDTSMGSGMLSLDPEDSYNPGDILIIGSSDPPGGGFIFPTFPDTVDGQMNLQLGAAEKVILAATGSGNFEILGFAPKLYAVEFANGGDTFTLPDLDTVPAGYTQLVLFNSGPGQVTVEPFSGQTLTGGDQVIDTLYKGLVFINTGYNAWEPYTKSSDIEPSYSPNVSISRRRVVSRGWSLVTDERPSDHDRIEVI